MNSEQLEKIYSNQRDIKNAVGFTLLGLASVLLLFTVMIFLLTNRIEIMQSQIATVVAAQATTQAVEPTPYIVPAIFAPPTVATPTVTTLPTAVVVTASPTASPTATPTPDAKTVTYDRAIALALNKLVVGRTLAEELMIVTTNESWSMDDDYRWNFKMTYAMNLIQDGIGDLDELNLNIGEEHPRDRNLESHLWLTQDASEDLYQASSYGYAFYDDIALADQNEIDINWEVAHENANSFFLLMNDAWQDIFRWSQEYENMEGMGSLLWSMKPSDWTLEVETSEQ